MYHRPSTSLSFSSLGPSPLVFAHETWSRASFQVGSRFAYVTWDAVFDYGTTTPETMQYQFDLATGVVTMIWQSITGQGNDYLVGFSPGGPSIDPGSTDLSVTLPTTILLGADYQALTLSASPVAISTATSGSTVTYTTDNMLAFAPGVYIGMNILSMSQIPAPGVDLVIIGAPGCAALVGSIDLPQTMVGTTPTQSVSLTLPPGIPAGTTIYSQSVSLFQPNTLPGGLNSFGMTTSNGIASVISTH